ncbi:MAG: hypothetical protein ACU837_11220 [Gammaproteobacteria bacterium]
MNKQSVFEQLAAAYDLKPADFYFLDLIPLIEMLWANGQNKPEELDVLYKFAIEHVVRLDRQAGVQAIYADDANDFLERFALRRPSAKLLQALRSIAAFSAPEGEMPLSQTVLDYCLNIAAACTAHCSVTAQQQELVDEKGLLERLFLFEQLVREHDLKAADFYFLDLIPLIEMLWADGQNIPAELDTLYKLAIEHVAQLDRQGGGPPVSVDDMNSFLERFALRRPPQALLSELRKLAAPHARPDLKSRVDAAYTVDALVAAQQRLMSDEKALLRQLFSEFNIPPETPLE